MLLAIAVAFVSVGLGISLGLARTGTRVALGAVRSFALVAALATVALELLPGAAARGGAPAIAVFAVAATLPWLLEKIGGRVGAGRSSGLRLEMGYLALLVHHVGDGLGLGAYTGSGHHDHVHWDVLVSIGGHTVPVTAVVVLAYARRGVRAAAVARGAGFALAIAAGIFLARAIPVASFEVVEPYVTAAVGGLLLHVATHDWLEDVPRSRGGRLLDLVAAAAGVALVLASTAAHDHHGGAVHEAPGDVVGAASAVLLRYAPAVLAAVVLGALLARSAPPRVAPGGGVLATIRAALLGATVGVGPDRVIALAPAARPGRPGPVAVALALGAGGIGLETLAVASNAFGPPFAAAWVALAVVLIAAVARASARGSTDGGAPVAGSEPAEGATPARPRVGAALEDGVARCGAALAIGVVGAAVLSVTLRDGALAPLSLPKLDVLLLPLAVAALGAPPLAIAPALLVLVDKGANAPAALAALAVAAATRRSVAAWAHLSVRSIGLAVGLAAAVAYGLAWVRWPASPARSRPPTAIDPIELACAAVLAALALAGLWRRGVRPWLAESLDARAHHHHHGPCFEESAGPAHDHHDAARARSST